MAAVVMQQRRPQQGGGSSSGAAGAPLPPAQRDSLEQRLAAEVQRLELGTGQKQPQHQQQTMVPQQQQAVLPPMQQSAPPHAAPAVSPPQEEVAGAQHEPLQQQHLGGCQRGPTTNVDHQSSGQSEGGSSSSCCSADKCSCGGGSSSSSSSSDADALAAVSAPLQQQSEEALGPQLQPSSAAGLHAQAEEPLLHEDKGRYALSPIKFWDVWRMYKQELASFWTVDEVDLSNDLRDWARLTSAEQHFIKYVLAFFAGSDGIVLENLAIRFMQDISIPEVRAFYGFQLAMENIHSEMYSVLLETYVSDAAERLQLLQAIEHIPVIQKKAHWALKWISGSQSFAQRLLAFACVEGIHFSGSFCAIFWLKKRGLMPGLTFSNELISRDEGLHTDFACLLYSYLRHPLAQSEVHALVSEAVDLEQEFICEALECAVVGMNAALMGQYIRFVADRLLVSLGYAKMYNEGNPFDWMEMISLQGKTNFFERRVGEYQKAGVMANHHQQGSGLNPGGGGLPGSSGLPPMGGAGGGGGGSRVTFDQFVFTKDEDF